MSKPKLSIGTDPEFMLVDGAGNLKSAIGVVHGTKEEKIDLGQQFHMAPKSVEIFNL